MRTKSLTLGDVCLDKYIAEPAKLNEEREKEIDGLIGKIEVGRVFNIEKFLLQALKLERALYPTIDPSFLSTPNIVDYKGKEIQIPKFSIHKKTYKGFIPFFITIDAPPTITWDEISIGRVVYVNIGDVKEDEKFKLLCDQLIKATEFPKSSIFTKITQRGSYEFKKVPRRIRKKYVKAGYIYLTSNFYGNIPQKEKEKINEAEEIFDDQLYLIAETKPNEWSTTRFVKDLLVMGIFKDKCYLVSYFGTEPIKDKIKNEFRI